VFALSELGYIALRRDDAERAEQLCGEALAVARSLGDDRALSAALSILSDVARTRGDHERSLAYAEEALERRRALGDPTTIVDSTYHFGVAAFAAGDLDRSEAAFEAALEHGRAIGDSLYTAAALCMLGTTGLLKDDLTLVEKRLNESLAIYLGLDDDRSCAECLSALGGYAAATGHPEEAARIWGAGDAARGSRPLEYAEPAIEARFTPSLVDSLGAERFAELRAQGRHDGSENVLATLRDVVAPAGAE
jgi:tetratricopeptide (TPR) repeat protein